MRFIRIGDIVTYKPRGSHEMVQSEVTGIEICKPEMKYGKEVPSCDLDKHPNVVLNLADNHWCDKQQIASIKSI